ncbi:MAG: hypothetical protein R3B70_18240 [Polyangiaceae bacterium]
MADFTIRPGANNELILTGGPSRRAFGESVRFQNDTTESFELSTPHPFGDINIRLDPGATDLTISKMSNELYMLAVPGVRSSAEDGFLHVEQIRFISVEGGFPTVACYPAYSPENQVWIFNHVEDNVFITAYEAGTSNPASIFDGGASGPTDTIELTAAPNPSLHSIHENAVSVDDVDYELDCSDGPMAGRTKGYIKVKGSGNV